MSDDDDPDRLACKCGAETFEVKVVGKIETPDAIVIRCTDCAAEAGWRLENAYDA